MAQYYTLPTAVGEAKLANAIALGGTITISELALGDGGGTLPTPDSDRIALINEVRRAPINTSVVDEDNPNWIVVEQVIPPDVGGWTIREVGLYDADGDMIAYGNYPETYKPQLSEGTGRTQTIRFVMQVSDTAAVTLKVDPSVVLATRAYVDNSIRSHAESRNHPYATTTAQGMAELATGTEATGRADKTRVLTPETGGLMLKDHEQAETAHNAGQIALAESVDQAPDAKTVAAALSALGAFAGDGFQNMRLFPGAGDSTFEVPDVLRQGLRHAHVTVIGAGGGGGNTRAQAGAGGGEGGKCIDLVDLTGVTSVPITVGAGGRSGDRIENGGVAENGSSSSFGEYASATGGQGGGNYSGGAGGMGMGGSIRIGGGPGGNAANASNDGSRWGSGQGGGAGGKASALRGTEEGRPGQSSGGGGSGNVGDAGSGDGANGIVIVRW